ncbi:MAG: hypothetical protein Q9186_001143 [Xanthomendoza sp. 1 TL-2023]
MTPDPSWVNSPSPRAHPMPSSTTPHGLPIRTPVSVGQPLSPVLHSKSRSPQSPFASPGYFGFSAEQTTNPTDPTPAHPRRNKAPGSMTPRQSVLPPRNAPQDPQPRFEAFRRQSESNHFSLKQGSLSHFSAAADSKRSSPSKSPDSVRSRRDSSCSPRPRKKPSLEKEQETQSLEIMDMDNSTNDIPSQSSKSTQERQFIDSPRSQSPANTSNLDLSTMGRTQPSHLDERHQRNSLPHNAIDPHPASLHSAHRAETLPTGFNTDGPTMISAHDIGQVIKDHLPPDLLILDVRVFAQYSQSRILGALNLNLPTTLLKRPNYDVQRLAATFTDHQEKAKFDGWQDTKVIIVYDAASSHLKDAATCVNTLKKFTKEGWVGSALIIKGGFASFSKRCPDMVDSGSGDEEGNKKKLSIDPSKPVAGGCLMPAQQTAAMPFFSAIRQNMDLRDGVGQLPINLPQSLNEKGISELPGWLKTASDECDKGRLVSTKFLAIEQAEQKRMQQAYSTDVSYGSPEQQSSKKIQIAGIEKGTKNRYKDMLPYDHSRVRLQNIPVGDCDYVNASHLKAEWSHRHYIASQAPVPATFQDFWNVTWQQDARVIVMLTAESEGGQTKCHPYWLPGNYGSLKVQTIGERRVSLDLPKLPMGDGAGAQLSSRIDSGGPGMLDLASPERVGHGRRRSTSFSNVVSSQSDTAPRSLDPDAPHVIVRKLMLSHDAQPYAPMREITQLQYTSWPDFGAPAHPLHVLGLVEQCGEVMRGHSGSQRLDDPAPQGERPVVVHCSAGCGRTGTFCTVDSVIDMMKRQQQAGLGKDDADMTRLKQSVKEDNWITSDADDLIAKAVEDFRLQRLSMVQTLRQFVLCYESVLEWVATQMPDTNIKKPMGQDRRKSERSALRKHCIPTMSLFSQPAPKSSIFGNQGSLSGNTASSQPQQSQSVPTTSIFANLQNQAQSPPAQNSLFPNLGTIQQNQPVQASLFSNLGTSQPQQQTSSLFGPPKPVTSQSTTSSLFAPQAASGAFGASQQQQSQSTQNDDQRRAPARQSQPAYFDSLLEKGKKRARDTEGASGFGELPGLQLGLTDIARRVREIGGVGTQTPADRAADSKAHYLLAASGVNLGTTRRDLDALNAQPTASTSSGNLLAEWDPDTNSYMDQMQQQSTLKMIAEGIERAHRNFDAYLDENIDINWEAQRKKIYEHFGLASRSSERSDAASQSFSSGVKGSFGRSSRRGRMANGDQSKQSTLGRSIFGQSSLQKSVIGTPNTGFKTATLFADVEDRSRQGAISDDRFSRDKQTKFAERVQALNRARLQERSYPILHEFKGVQMQPGGESPSQLIDAYKALIDIVREPSDPQNAGQAVPKQRQFLGDYLDETPNSAKQLETRRRILDGSRRSLEQQFFEGVESLINRNAREANLGGVPTPINKIRAYIRVRDVRKDLKPDELELQKIDDIEPMWAVVYFLLRCGLVQDAADYVKDNLTTFRAIERNFFAYIASYAKDKDRRLARDMQDRINNEYQQKVRMAPENSLDPYKMACYKIIGRCELTKRTIEGINQSSNDWLWLQFCLAREINRVEEVAGDVFGLEEIRESVSEIGQRHYQKGQEGLGGYATYFHLLILAGMFEKAISFLFPYTYVAAVHFAIALDYYGLLRVSDQPDAESDLMTYNTKDLPQISFGRMLGYYTRDFRTSNLDAAVDYLVLICLNIDLPGAAGKAQASLCHEALRELVLESREFAQLLGDIHQDGTRLKGTIEQRLKLIGLSDQEMFLKTVTVQAASVADDNGRTTDAVLLYHLAEDYDNVIAIVNRALSDSLAVSLSDPEPKLSPLKPRQQQQSQNPQLQQQDLSPNSSFSLTAVSDPPTLARNMISLYDSNPLYLAKIRPQNRQTCGTLLRLSAVKSHIQAQNWAAALDTIAATNLLPLAARGSIPAIRAHAATTNQLPQEVKRGLGNLVLWCIMAVGGQREVLRVQKGGFEDVGREGVREELKGVGRDLMTFAGLVRYRLERGVWEAVVRAGGDVGGY